MKQRGRGADRGLGKVRGNSPVVNVPMYSPDIDYKAIGQKLKDERDNIGWTQEEVAEIIGISAAFVGHLERSERSMSLNTLIHFCNLYHITIDYLLSDTLPPQNDNVASQIANMLKTKSADQQAAILDILRSIIRHI